MPRVVLRAIVFDFDGLICDTEWPEYRSVADAFDTHGLDFPPESWVQVIGTSWNVDWMSDLETRLGRTVDRDALVAARRVRRDELLAGLVVLPGVVELIELARARSLGLAVASSSPADWVGPHLERLGLAQHFGVVVTRDDVAHAKPAPDLYLLACERLGVDPADAVAVEDSAPGAHAARAAGVRCVVVPNRLTSLVDLSHADLRLESLADVQLAQFEALLVAAGPDPQAQVS